MSHVCVYMYYIYFGQSSGLHCCTHGFSPAAASKGCLFFLVVHRLLIEVALLEEHVPLGHVGFQ